LNSDALNSDASNGRDRPHKTSSLPTLDLRWQVPLAVSVIAIGLTVWVAAAYMIPLAFSAGDRIDRLTSVSPASLFGSESGALESLKNDLDELDSDISGAATAFRWVGQMTKGLSWVPLMEREVTSWEFAATRAERDVEAALALIAGTQAVTAASGAVGAAFTQNAAPSDAATGSDGTENGATGVNTAVETARREFARAASRLDRGWRGGESGGIALRLPGLRSAVAGMESTEARMAAAAEVGLATTDLFDVALEIARQARPIVGPILGTSNSGLPDSDELARILATIEAGADEAATVIDRVSGMLAKLGDAGSLQRDLADLDLLLASVGDLTAAAGLGIDVLRPILDLASGDGQGLLGGAGLALALDSVSQDSLRLDEAIGLADAAANAMEQLQLQGSSALLGGPVSELATAARSFHEGLDLVSGLSRIGGALFGPGEDRSYLVLGQSADELRPTGGFVSAVWVISLSDGALDQVEYFDVVRVDDYDRIALYPVGPPGLEEHMNGWVWLMRDVSWDPDFPTSAVVAQDIFNLGQRRTVDGVIAVNQWAMLELVEALGSVASPDGGEPITSRNFLTLMELGTDRHGTSYSDLVVRGLFDALKQPRSLSQLLDLAAASLRALENRDLLIQINDKRAAEVISAQGWSGEVTAVDHDYIGVFDSNVGWSKVDRNIQRSLNYAVDLSNPNVPRATLRLTYQNHSSPGSPPCNPQWRFRGSDYSTLKNACYWNYLRVLMPGNIRLLDNTELPLPEQSVSVESGFGTPGQDTSGVSSNHGLTVFSGLVSIEASTSREISLVYDLPASTVELIDGQLTYRLLIQKQPGVPRRGVSVELRAPGGFELESSSLQPFSETGTTVRYEISQTNDILLEVVFTSPTAVKARN